MFKDEILNVVDQELVSYLKKKFEEGPNKADPDDFLKVIEFVRQLAEENDDVRKALGASDFRCQVIIRDVNKKFWLTTLGGKLEYGEGEVDDPSFTFKGLLKVLAGVIFGVKDGPANYLAGELTIEGSVTLSLAFNEIILVTLDAFQDLTAEI